MKFFIAEISAAIGDDFGKAVKVLNKSENTEDLQNAILSIADAIDNLREGVEENKMNYSPSVTEGEKAKYFTNKEKEKRANISNNQHRSAP